MRKEDLEKSAKEVGQILPVIKDQHGNILDGFHRKRVDPDWKETIVTVTDPLQALRIRVHANYMRRPITLEEKHAWVLEARKILQERGENGSVREIADALTLPRATVQDWLTKYQDKRRLSEFGQFYGYNVWGFRDESWRELIIKGDPEQPDKEFYHGSTPAFVIHQLIKLFQPKSVLDSMAGVGTVGYVCNQYNPKIECDQYDLYPYPKYGVEEGDAEKIGLGKTYDLIFNHIPYLGMTKYGDHPEDLSNMKPADYYGKLNLIFKRNHDLLKKDGIYAVLVGDWRFGGKLIPITAKTTMLALDCGFNLRDEAIKLTAEAKGLALQEYRATKGRYLAQTYDTVLMFQK